MSTVVEVCGYACFVAAGWLIAPFLGLVVAGVVLLLFAHAIEGLRVRLPRPAVSTLKAMWARVPRLRVVRPGEAGVP